MNPYELSQASSDAIQTLIDSAQKLMDHHQPPGGGGLLPAILDNVQQLLHRLQQLHSKSWNQLRRNSEHAELLMARLESLDVLCGRLLAGMSAAKRISGRGNKIQGSNIGGTLLGSSGGSGYELLIRSSPAGCCSTFIGDELAELLIAMSDELGKWLDHQEEMTEKLSCQAYGILPRPQSQSLEGFQRIPKVVRKIGETLLYGEQRCIVVHGPAGVGKSTLAAFVAATPPHCFTDGVAEIKLGKRTDRERGEEDEEMVERLRHLVHELSSCQREAPLNRKVTGVEEWWKLIEEVAMESSHLIVVDEVCCERDLGFVERLLQLRNHSCKFLLTCQDDLIPLLSSADADQVCSIGLGFRETATVSEEILKFHTGLKELPAIASKLLRYCTHHPLSVSILGESLRGCWKKQEWRAVLNHLDVFAGLEAPKKKNSSSRLICRRNSIISRSSSSSITPLNWMAGVFASIEIGRAGMQPETQQLFDSLSVLSWASPVPIECLKALWGAVPGSSKSSPFLVHVRELVRRCLLKRRPDFIFYEAHELVALYLEQKLQSSLDELLRLSQPGVRASLAPWLLELGNESAKQAAAEALHGVLVLDDEELHAKALISIVEVLKACSSAGSSSVCKKAKANAIVGAEIVSLLFRASSSWVYAAITRYISACFSEVDYEEYGRGLVASGLVEKLQSLLLPGSTGSASGSGVSPLVKKDVADVVARLASGSSRDPYVVESLIRARLMQELVKLVDSRSGWIHDGAINAVVKLAELGDDSIQQLLETDMVEKLLQLLQSRKQSPKLRSVEAIGSLVRSGGSRVVERLVAAGIGEEMEAQLGDSGGSNCNSASGDVRAECCAVWREVFARASEGSLERLMRSKVVESLTGLLGDGEAEKVRSEAVAALQELVKLRGKPVIDRIVRAAGVGSFVKGLESLPTDAAYTAAYKNLLESIVD